MSNAMSMPEAFAEAPEPDVLSLDRERAHRQMLSAVSHDLKTPLASIIGSLEVYTRMKDKLPIGKQMALIDVALQEAYRLDAFITNILDMTRLENDAIKPKRENVEIGAMLRNCLIRMDRPLQGKTVELQAMSGPLNIVTDDVLLSRTVCLVLDNAAKYGGSSPAIQVEFGKDGDHAGYIRVRDHGPGIPEHQMEALFSKYTHFGRGNQQHTGTGLGLALAREIMRLLNGTVVAANHPEGGALLTLAFPLA